MAWLGNSTPGGGVGGSAALPSPTQLPNEFVTNTGNPVSGIPSSPASATVYQNTSGRPLWLIVQCQITTTSGGVIIALGPTNTPSQVAELGGSNSVTGYQTTVIPVPAGWYVSFTVTTATVTVTGLG